MRRTMPYLPATLLTCAALVSAVRANDETQFPALLGSDGTALLSSGDSVQDERN